MERPVGDPDIDDAIAAGVDRGEFATMEEARADFCTSLEEAIEQLESGRGLDGDAVFAELHERYAYRPRAAE